MRIFEALFKVVSTRFGLRIVENSIENPHFIFCSSFQNLRLGSIKFADVSFELSRFCCQYAFAGGGVHTNLCEMKWCVCQPVLKGRLPVRKDSKERACRPRCMVISPTCPSNSQEDDSMPICLSKIQDDDTMSSSSITRASHLPC